MMEICFKSKFIFYFILWHVVVISMFCSCFKIERAPSKWRDDGASKFGNVEDAVLFQSDKLTILAISATELFAATKNSSGFIYVWAPWCAHCLYTLKYQYTKTFNEVDNLVFVSTNYDIKNIVKLLEGKVDTAYVLDSSTYGNNENSKLKGISKLLIEKELEGIPQFYEFNYGLVRLKNSNDN